MYALTFFKNNPTRRSDIIKTLNLGKGGKRLMNETTCYYFINISENPYTHLKEISTEVQIPDYNYKQGPFGNDLNISVKVSKKILACLEKGKAGEVYNLGGHNERNNLYIVKRILSELGKPETLINHVADRNGHDQRYAIDPHKANVELNWDPITTFEVGIKKTIDWYLSEKGSKWLDECMAQKAEWLKKNYDNRK